MNNIKLMIISLLSGAFRVPAGFSTANAAAEAAPELAEIQARLDALEHENAELRERQANSTGTQPTAADPLGLGGLQLPKGVEAKDIIWRKEAGLSLKHAVQAAVSQVRYGKKLAAIAAEKVAAAEKRIADAAKAKAGK